MINPRCLGLPLLTLFISACGAAQHPATTPPDTVMAASGAGTDSVTATELRQLPMPFPGPDVTQPSILSTTPGSSAIGVDRAASITIQFSEPMNQGATEAAFFLFTGVSSSNVLTYKWNVTGTLLTVTHSAPYNDGAQVIWIVNTGAKDLAGNALKTVSGQLRDFTVLKKSTFKLYSNGQSDGWVYSSGARVHQGQQRVRTDAWTYPPADAGSTRGLITFLLDQVPSASKAVQVVSASLHLYQELPNIGPQCVQNQAYKSAGNVLAQAIYYPPDIANTQTDYSLYYSSYIGFLDPSNVLSNNATTGYKTLDVTKQIAESFKSPLYPLSQWALRFEHETLPVSPSDTCATTHWGAGYAVADHKPYLEITYLHP